MPPPQTSCGAAAQDSERLADRPLGPAPADTPCSVTEREADCPMLRYEGCPWSEGLRRGVWYLCGQGVQRPCSSWRQNIASPASAFARPRGAPRPVLSPVTECTTRGAGGQDHGRVWGGRPRRGAFLSRRIVSGNAPRRGTTTCKETIHALRNHIKTRQLRSSYQRCKRSPSQLTHRRRAPPTTRVATSGPLMATRRGALPFPVRWALGVPHGAGWPSWDVTGAVELSDSHATRGWPRGAFGQSEQERPALSRERSRPGLERPV